MKQPAASKASLPAFVCHPYRDPVVCYKVSRWRILHRTLMRNGKTITICKFGLWIAIYCYLHQSMGNHHFSLFCFFNRIRYLVYLTYKSVDRSNANIPTPIDANHQIQTHTHIQSHSDSHSLADTLLEARSLLTLQWTLKQGFLSSEKTKYGLQMTCDLD